MTKAWKQELHDRLVQAGVTPVRPGPARNGTSSQPLGTRTWELSSARHCNKVRYPAVTTTRSPMGPPRRVQYRALYALLDETGLGVAEATLRFVISNPVVSCVLTGVKSAVEVEQNAAALAQGPLPADVLAKLDEVAAAVRFRPFDEPPGLPFNRPFRGPGPMV